MKIGDVEIKWLGHSGIMVKNSKIIYIDPYQIKDNMEKADIILITHSHYDHCSVADIQKIVKEGTRILLTADSQSKITRFEVPIQIEIVGVGKEIDFGNLKISTFPAYNINKNFHQKDEEWIGFLLKMDNLVLYHAGDTDIIPEMQKLTGHKQVGKEFIAFLPVGGRYTMTAEEAAEAAKIIKPTLAVPIHYGSIAGSEEDAKEFVELCKENGIDAKILERE
jgi:L-ascorbate metabolism protein UlaG (beta-lactamase superfamily)